MEIAALALVIGKQAARLAQKPLLKAAGLDALSQALKKANAQFLTIFSKELEYREVLSGTYTEAFEGFCKQDGVQQDLAEPFDGESALNWKHLASMWTGQVALPDDFDWNSITKKYSKAVQIIIVESPELRPIYDSRNTARSADHLRAIAGVKPGFDLAQYRSVLLKEYGALRLGSLDPDSIKYEIRLRSVYVPQTVKEALPPRELTRDYRHKLEEEGRLHGIDDQRLLYEEYTQSQARPVEEIIDDPGCRSLVILGDPGLGKSTLLQWLAVRWAETGAEPIPFLIELRRYTGDVTAHQNVLEFFEKGNWTRWRFSQTELDRHLREEESLVLFDGLDEVFDPKRRSIVINEVIRFTREYPRARVIVTTRVVGYHPGSRHPEEFRNAGFRHFTLQDFDNEIEEFIRVWHIAAFPTDAVERDRFERRLRKGLDDSRAVRELAANPLLLTLMAILSRKQNLPRARAKLYDKCAELLISDWETDKFPESREKIGPQHKRRMLQLAAFAMQSERTGLAGNLISEERLKQIFTDYLTELHIPETWNVVDDLVKNFRERNFMLSFLGDGQYAFVHRTFLEYFCAREYQHLFEKTKGFGIEGLRDLFSRRWQQDEWHEVLRLICALIGPEYAAEMIAELLRRKSDEEGWRAVFVAADCLSEVQEPGKLTELRAEVLTELNKLMDYGHDKYLLVDVRTAAMECRARGWKEDPETLPWLKRAVHCEDSFLNYTAVREVARNWSDNEDTERWLQDQTHSEDPVVRMTAVWELVQGWRLDLDMLRIVKDLATRDENLNVRITAALQLARGWKDDPETLIILKKLAQDQITFADCTARAELAYDWKDDPDVQAVLAGLPE